MNSQTFSVDEAVRDRYSRAAADREESLCCPVSYDPQYLRIIPQEILEKDYGCGDPSRHLERGDTVLDLGSGGGKICYIASQVVGPEGRVIGVDANADMLALARRHQSSVADELGYANVEFRRGRIQDLRLDLDLLDSHLADRPVQNTSAWLELQDIQHGLRMSQPLVPDDSIDVIVSNCVLNLVNQADRQTLFAEMMRVLRRGGRCVISDVVCDEDVPEALQNDPRLWSGCLSGAWREDRFVAEFERAGFYGIEILSRQSEPWTVVDGIEFRSMTVRAWKGKDGPGLDRQQAVIYNGPWKAVIDDDGHQLERGQRMAVCDKTFEIYSRAPYAASITPVEPAVDVPLDQAPPYDCRQGELRDPAVARKPGPPATSATGDGSQPTADPSLNVMPDQCCGENHCC